MLSWHVHVKYISSEISKNNANNNTEQLFKSKKSQIWYLIHSSRLKLVKITRCKNKNLASKKSHILMFCLNIWCWGIHHPVRFDLGFKIFRGLSVRINNLKKLIRSADPHVDNQHLQYLTFIRITIVNNNWLKREKYRDLWFFSITSWKKNITLLLLPCQMSNDWQSNVALSR